MAMPDYSSQGAAGFPTAAKPLQIDTLASGLAHCEGLHNRLNELVEKAHKIAAMVGGPFPIGSESKNAAVQPETPPVVQRLNDTTRACHRQADQLNECLDAMARSLGD